VYVNWNSWVKGVHSGPPSTVGVNAVVHLISDDIYIGIKFVSWPSRGGPISYQRTTAPAVAVSPIPIALTKTGNSVVLTWTNSAFNLQTATNVAGPYMTIAGSTSPFTNTPSGSRLFYGLIH
jgi:hypothetical protein